MKRILVADGNSIINRAYYGMRPLTTKSGKSTHAVYGMINIIQKQIQALSPDYVAVAFDLKAPTFRHEMFPEYKAGRSPTPEDLKAQFPDAKECLRMMGIHVLELEGYEADDIQGTIAKMAHGEEDTESYVLSGDRDLLQLIDDKVTVLLLTNSETKAMKREQFTEEYGITPEQFVDMKALMGDSSDNIPGVAGIGKKTAATLISSFGTLEGIYESIDDKAITKGVREKLLRDKENAFLSRTLARINTESPIGLGLEDLRMGELDRAGLFAKFSELELSSMITRFGLDKQVSEDAAAGSDKKSNDGAESASCNEASDAGENEIKYVAMTAEEIIKTLHAPIVMQILQTDVYICDKANRTKLSDDITELSEWLYGKELTVFDGKEIYHYLADRGLDVSQIRLDDLMMYAYVLAPGSGIPTPHATVAMFTSASPKPGEPSAAYFLAAKEEMAKKVKECGLEHILYDIELPLVPILADMERVGFMIDSATIREFGEALGELAEELKTRIYMLAGHEFNINSPKQLGVVLFEELGLKPPKKTKTGYATDAETLEELRAESMIIDDILEYRQVTKLRGTYAEALPLAADEGGRIHTDFKQAMTATGRLSSAEPNLQNIPIRTKMGREMRRSFIAKDGYTLVDADYSQIELRLLAHISDDYTMKDAFINGDDIHTRTASAVFGVPFESVNSEMRKKAKAVNFGIVYGIGGFSLSKDLGISVAEATRYIKSYMMNYPSIERYLESVVEEAKECGYTTTLCGRRRYIPELKAQNGNLRAFGKRVAMNAPIQGTAADIMKLAMIGVYNRLKSEGLDAKLVMQVHDELIVEVADRDVERCKEVVREEMENVMELSVPLTVDVTSGKNWLEQV